MRTRGARVPKWRTLTLLCPFLLRTHNHHGAVSVADDGGGDASHQRPSYPTKAPAPHDYKPGAQLLGQVDNGLIATFSDPKVGFFHTPSRLFELSHLLVEHLLSISPYRFERLLIGFVAQAAFVYVVNGIRVSQRYSDEVQLRVCSVGEVGCGAGGQLCLPRAVGG